ncbi:MAG: hypothetical protein N2255_01110, partial [Kiritimatiellae bacterium]|nr:hypothetical protein [Kiritimatiellia bacterium]
MLCQDGYYGVLRKAELWHKRCYSSGTMSRGYLFLLFLFAASPFFEASGQEWIQRQIVDHPSVNVSLRIGWKPENGLRLKFVSQECPCTVTLTLTRKDGRIEAAPPEGVHPMLAEQSWFQPQLLPASPDPALMLILKVRPEVWALYLENGQLLAHFPPPFSGTFSVSHPTHMLPPSDALTVSMQKVEDFRFQDSFLVPEGEQNQLAAWEVVSGNWRLHTVTRTPVERERPWRAVQRPRAAVVPRKSERSPEPERSPNFYSLLGSGTNAIITAGYDFYDTYEVEAAVQLTPGEMGLVFLLSGDKPVYHAFTALVDDESPEVRFRLWRTTAASEAREVLAGVAADFTKGQWLKLRAKIFHHRIQCYVDRTLVIDLPIKPPLGGRFGLFASTNEGTRFDDVVAKSNHDLNLRSLNEIRQAVLLENGRFLGGRRSPGRSDETHRDEYLEPQPTRREQWLILGYPRHAPHVFAATFEPQRDTFCVGLIAGYSGPKNPYMRFILHRFGENEALRLERVESGVATVLEEMKVGRSGKPGATRHPVTLMFDAATLGQIRLYRDGEMVLIHHSPETMYGASGLYVGPDSPVRISDLTYRFERSDLYRNQFEKNRAFVDDPFMRHWSSPEGQWLEDKDGMTWHKGDFFGRFMIRLPYIEKTTLHLGIEEGKTNGAVVVTARDGKISLLTREMEQESSPCVPVSALATGRPASDAEVLSEEAWRDLKWYAVEYEGYWVWLTSGGRLLLKQRLDVPLSGRRVRVTGFKPEQLKYSYVERYNVKDYLFTESLHEWTISAGRWEVVNRFQCDPRWSHMNGESKDGQAGIWTKFVFGGDFCAEMYAGTRMGWYERCGDLNITVLNRRATPSEGYTLTCTGWDPDHSQLYTRLYREGKVIAESDKYLVPRMREGNKRLGYNPLIAPGRDVHGAWYYLKLRRTGKRLQFYFDNELIFTADDDQPIQDGSMGIWTFINSMMIARVTMAAERIVPKTLPFRTLSPAEASDTPVASKRTAVRISERIYKDGLPLERLLPDEWEPEAPAGDPHVVWHREKGGSNGFVVLNVHGNPEMAVLSHMPPVPYAELAGWRFLVKRT